MTEPTAAPDAPEDQPPPSTGNPEAGPVQPADPYAERSAQDQLLSPGDDPD